MNIDYNLYGSSNSRAFVFHKLINSTTFDDFLIIWNNGSATLKGNLITNGVSIATLNTNTNTNTTNITNVTNEVNNLKTGVSVDSASVDLSKALNASIINASTLNKLSLNAGLSLSANPIPLVYVKGRLGVNIENPVAGSNLHVLGNSTMDGQFHITGNIDGDSNINASSFTINDTINVVDTLTNNATLINSNSSRITLLETYKKKFLENSYANNQNISYGGGKWTSNKEIQLIFTSKNASPIMPGLNFPVTFQLSCFFYREDTMVVGQCSCDLMILPTSFLASWGTEKNTNYCINNNINGSTSFGSSGRQYWTFNQNFEMTTGGAGYLWGYNTVDYTTQIWTHTIKIAILFNAPCTYTFNVKSLDLTGASNFNVDIVF
jgi:hypothetical protein